MKVVSMAGSAFANQTDLKEIIVPETITEIGAYAFSGCTSLNSCSVRGITEMEEGLFDGCTSLEKIDLANCLEIGDNAFQGNTTISILGLDNVKYIGDSAFAGCTSLSNITSWANLESIGPRAFMNCPSLKTIHLTDKITSISEYAFANCENIDQVIIYGNIQTMGQGAFQACKKLQKVDIRGTCEMIGDNAFEGCTKLSSINLKEGLTYIGFNAFEECDLSDNFTLPNTLTEIGRAAFWRCKGLSSITIPQSVTTIEPAAFAECDKLTSITVNGSNANYSSDNGILYNKNQNTLICYPAGKASSSQKVTVNGKVNNIEEYAFAGAGDKNDSLKISSGVKTIGNNAFTNSNFLFVQIPSTVDSIGVTAFEGAYNSGLIVCMVDTYAYQFATENGVDVTTVGSDDTEVSGFMLHSPVLYYTLSDGSIDIIKLEVDVGMKNTSEGGVTGDEWFCLPRFLDDQEKKIHSTVITSVNEGRTKFYVGADLMTLKPKQFENWKNLQEIKFGQDTLKIVGQEAFMDTNIKDINHDGGSSHGDTSSGTVKGQYSDLPCTVKTIGERAFKNCTELTSFVMPKEVDSILESTFEGCTNLKNIKLQEGLVTIEDNAFYGCKELEEINIPNSVTYIGSKAFAGCTKLKKITFQKNEDICIAPDAFAGCGNLIIDIDRNQLNIADYAESNEIPYIASYDSSTQIYLQVDDVRYIFLLDESSKKLTLINYELRNGIQADEVEEIYIPDSVGGYDVSKISTKFDKFKNLERIGTNGNNSAAYNLASEKGIPYILDSDPYLNWFESRPNCRVCGSKKYNTNWRYTFTTEDGESTAIYPYSTSNIETVVVPYCIDGTHTDELLDKSFSENNKGEKNVIISFGIQTIGNNCFENNNVVEKILIPKTIKTVEDNCFKNINSNATVYCYKGSEAEKCLQASNIPYELIDEHRQDVGGLIKQIKFDNINMFNKMYSELLNKENIFNADESTMTIEMTQEMISEVTTLDLSNSSITNLEGIENFTNLENLNLSGNQITDLSKLTSLTKLQSLNLLQNPISDISALSGLSSLKTLKIGNDEKRTSIDLSTIEKLINLEDLTMVYLNIQDLTPFNKLNKLANLDLSFNNISDVSELGKITSLKKLRLISNKISNIDGLKTLNSLEDLNLQYNQIEDISALEGLGNLDTLLLDNQKLNTEEMEMTTVELPEVFKQATKKDSIGYMGLNDFTLENCTQGEDKTKITIDEGVQTASVTIVGGILKGTKLSIAVTKNPDLPEVRLRGIQITKAPNKTNYIAGETFSTDGMVVTATYSDGTTKPVTGYTVEPLGALTTENTSVTIIYTEYGITKTANQNITVTPKQGQDPDPEKTVASITLKQLPTKTTYKQSKEDLDVTGGKIEVTYSDGSKEIIDISKDMVTGFDNTTVGKQVLTVSYGGKTVNYEIEIVADGTGSGDQGGSGDEGQGGSGSGDQGGSGDESQGGIGSGSQGGSGDEGQGGSGSGSQGGSGDQGQGSSGSGNQGGNGNQNGSGTGNQSSSGSGSGDQNGTGSGNSQNKTGNDSTVKKDVSGEDLTAKGSFPYTGRAVIGVVGIALAALAGISYISYRKYKNI